MFIARFLCVSCFTAMPHFAGAIMHPSPPVSQAGPRAEKSDNLAECLQDFSGRERHVGQRLRPQRP
jgi:hypothetical protein